MFIYMHHYRINLPPSCGQYVLSYRYALLLVSLHMYVHVHAHVCCVDACMLGRKCYFFTLTFFAILQKLDPILWCFS